MMATATEAVERIAQAADINHATVASVAKVLKQHNPPLLVRSKQGGGRGAGHVTPSDLTNLTFALTVSPIAAAPSAVLAMRNFVPPSKDVYQPFLPGRDLGETFDLLIDTCSFDGKLLTLIDQGRNPDLEIVRIGAGTLFVDIGSSRATAHTDRRAWRFCRYVDASTPQGHSFSPGSPTSITIHTNIPFALIRVLAELWADSRKRRLLPPLQAVD